MDKPVVKKYTSRLSIGGEPIDYDYETDENPIEYLWNKFGMTSYIEFITEIDDNPEIVVENEETVE